jgi:hypothetical protein
MMIGRDEHEQTVGRAKEAGPDWESRREKILDDLERNVGLMADFRSAIDGIPDDLPHADVENRLTAAAVEVRNRFPEESLKRFEEYRQCLDGLNRLKERKDDDLETAGASFIELTDRRRAFEARADVGFLHLLDRTTEMLIKKNEIIAGWRQDGRVEQEVLKRLREESGKEVRPTDLKEIRTRAFTIEVYVLPEAYDAATAEHGGGSADSLGYHLRNSPMSFIRAGSDQKPRDLERTARHERMHNLADGVAPMLMRRWTTTSDFDFYMDELTKRRRGGRRKGDELAKGLSDETFQAPTILDASREELVAEMENAEAVGFRRGPLRKRGREEDMLSVIYCDGRKKEPALPHEEFMAATGALATAGADYRRAHGRFLSEAARRKKDPVGKAQFEKKAAELREAVITMVRHLAENFALATAIGPEAQEELHQLAILIPPSKYRYLRTYLEHAHGKAKIEHVERAEGLISDFEASQDVDGLERLVAELEKEPMILSDEEAARMKEFLDERDGAVFAEDHIESLDDCRRYVAALRRFGELVGHDLAGRTEWSVYWQYFMARLPAFANWDFARLPEYRSSLKVEERKIFDEALPTYMGEYLSSDYGFEKDEDIRTSPHWKIVRELGLEAAAEKSLAEHERQMAEWQAKKIPLMPSEDDRKEET